MEIKDFFLLRIIEELLKKDKHLAKRKRWTRYIRKLCNFLTIELIVPYHKYNPPLNKTSSLSKRFLQRQMEVSFVMVSEALTEIDNNLNLKLLLSLSSKLKLNIRWCLHFLICLKKFEKMQPFLFELMTIPKIQGKIMFLMS